MQASGDAEQSHKVPAAIIEKSSDRPSLDLKSQKLDETSDCLSRFAASRDHAQNLERDQGQFDDLDARLDPRQYQKTQDFKDKNP